MRMPRSVVTGLERWPVTVSDSGAGRGMVNCVRAGSFGAVRLNACACAVLIADVVSNANTAAVVTFLILLSRVFLYSDFAVMRYSIGAMQKRRGGVLVGWVGDRMRCGASARCGASRASLSSERNTCAARLS